MKSKVLDEQNFKEITVSIDRLHFHPENPRRNPIADEDAIRSELCADEGVVTLAKHVSLHGLNPLDRIAVVNHPKLTGHYVVAEGNRRLCALQLLRDPQRAPTKAIRKIFEKYQLEGEAVPEQMGAVHFEKMASARIWMSVKHEGEQGGIGTVGWNATQKTRFNQQGSESPTRLKNPNVQALALLDYALNKGLITQSERDQIALTTITRYLTNPNVRSAIGLLTGDDLSTNAYLPQFDAAVQRFLTDSLPEKGGSKPPPVSSRTDSKERQAYAETLRKDGVAPTRRDEPPYVPKAAAASTKAKPRRSTPNPDLRRQLIPADFRQTSKDRALARMVNEGREILVDDYVFSCNYLLRAIFEYIVVLYANKYSVPHKPSELNKTIGKVAAHAQHSNPNPAPRKIVQIMNKASSDPHASYAPDTLGAGVHGGMIPKSINLKRDWDTLQPVLTWLLSQL